LYKGSHISPLWKDFAVYPVELSENTKTQSDWLLITGYCVLNCAFRRWFKILLILPLLIPECIIYWLCIL